MGQTQTEQQKACVNKASRKIRQKFRVEVDFFTDGTETLNRQQVRNRINTALVDTRLQGLAVVQEVLELK